MDLEKWYRWTGLQGRNRDIDVENKRMDTKGESGRVRGDGVMNWEIGIGMYTLICIKLMTNKNLLYKKIKWNKIQKLKKNPYIYSQLIFKKYVNTIKWGI